jgi:ketosteroid isomerase-like protein
MRTMAFIGVLLFGAATAGAQSESSVRKADSAWARSYAEHDTVTAKALFDDKLVVTSGNGSLKDKDGELADIRPSAGLQMHYFRTSDVQVRPLGGAATVIGLAEWSFTFNGRTNTIRRRYTAVYNQGGQLGWTMVVLHIGPAPAT